MSAATVVNGVPVEVAEQYAAEAAACWTLRDAAALSPAYDLLELCALDDRLERHLEGLRLAGGLGWELCAAALDGADPGEVFAAAIVSLDRRDWKAFARVLDAAGGEPQGARAIVSALGWSDFDRIVIALETLLKTQLSPPLNYLGVAAHAIHRRDPGGALEQVVRSTDRRLRARALRAIGELHRTDLRHVLSESLSHEDEACRFWAAWSATLLRDPRAGAALQDLAEKGGAFAERAAELAVRRMDVAAAQTWLESLSSHGEIPVRAALVGAGALGVPALMPMLIAHLGDKPTARLAAWSISLITNANVTGELGGTPPPGFTSGPTDDPEDPDVAMDPDDGLPWPDSARLEAWWRERGKEMPDSTRCIFGKPMSPQWLAHVLRHGNQAARAAAAVELSLRSPGHPLFEVRAPGYLQWESLPG